MIHHVPVLLDEVIELLDVNPKGIYMDCTIGFGGHSELILSKLNSNGQLINAPFNPVERKVTLE